MAREWKPGDVAVNVATGQRMILADLGAIYVWKSTNGHDVLESRYARPLVVIDPEDREQVERLVEAFDWKRDRGFDTDQMQAALRSLITPPRPPEPMGLGAVVEDEDGRRWVRTGFTPSPWTTSFDDDSGKNTQYADITVVRVLSEGVTS